MKNLLILCFLAITTNFWAQNVLVLQPGADKGKDVRLNSLDTYTSGLSTEFMAAAWTYKGDPGNDRSLIEFDLSAIDSGTTVVKAELFLYGTEGLPTGSHSALSGDNHMLVQRVISSWDELTVSWVTQPTVTDSNQIVVNGTDTEFVDYKIDVTNLVQDMVNDPENSFGFMFKQQVEDYYRRMVFASSDHADETQHPKLEITFEECIVIDTVTIYDTIKVYDSIAVTDTLYIDVTITSTPQVSITNQIKVYPNPTKDIVFINNGDYTLMNNYHVKIINTLSNTVFESDIDGEEFRVNISEFGSYGLYFIQLFNEKQELIDVRKIILE